MATNPSQKSGARYRRIAVEMYSDEKFLALSPTQPSGQSLWTYLLTGPFSTLIPGVCVGGEAGIAEALKWRVSAFRRCFDEIASRGMARADWNARVIFLPNALRYNPPQSPSVVIGWRQAWAEVPACCLKTDAMHHIRGVLADHGPVYAEAFEAVASRWPAVSQPASQAVTQAVTQAVPQPGGQPAPHQEQEQEQEQDVPPSPFLFRGDGQFRRRRHPLDEAPVLEAWSLEAFDAFMACYPRPEARKRALDVWRTLNPAPDLAKAIVADVQRRVAAGWASDLAFVPFPAKYLDEQRWQEPWPLKGRGAPVADRALDGLPCMRSCPDCGAVHEGRYQGGQKVFSPCPSCAPVAKVGV